MTVVPSGPPTLDGVAVSARRGAGHALRARSNSVGAVYRIALPVALWIVFVNVASHYQGRDAGSDDALRDVVEAELASRLCPGLRLDPASFREVAHERGIGHADLYQKRSPRLQKAAGQLQRRLRADPDGECQRLLDLYGGAGPAPRLLTRI